MSLSCHTPHVIVIAEGEEADAARRSVLRRELVSAQRGRVHDMHAAVVFVVKQDGDTVVYLAVLENFWHAAKALAEYGANVNAKNRVRQHQAYFCFCVLLPSGIHA